MATSLNKVQLIGYMGKDPEVRFTQGGKAVANFSLATDESYKNSNGEKIKKTEWHNLVIWGPSVENFVQKYLHKGDLIYVEGKLQTRSWEDKEGNKKYTTEINVLDIKAIQTGDGGQNKPATAKPAAKAAAAAAIADEDIPF
jgi:single-strand DNA-binding protein